MRTRRVRRSIDGCASRVCGGRCAVMRGVDFARQTAHRTTRQRVRCVGSMPKRIGAECAHPRRMAIASHAVAADAWFASTQCVGPRQRCQLRAASTPRRVTIASRVVVARADAAVTRVRRVANAQIPGFPHVASASRCDAWLSQPDPAPMRLRFRFANGSRRLCSRYVLMAADFPVNLSHRCADPERQIRRGFASRCGAPLDP